MIVSPKRSFSIDVYILLLLPIVYVFMNMDQAPWRVAKTCNRKYSRTFLHMLDKTVSYAGHVFISRLKHIREQNKNNKTATSPYLL